MDAAIKRQPAGPFGPHQWFYVIDGRPECPGIKAVCYLKSIGFSTEEAGKFLRDLQGPAQAEAVTEPAHNFPNEEAFLNGDCPP